jgi:hypothetical protein
VYKSRIGIAINSNEERGRHKELITIKKLIFHIKIKIIICCGIYIYMRALFYDKIVYFGKLPKLKKNYKDYCPVVSEQHTLVLLASCLVAI